MLTDFACHPTADFASLTLMNSTAAANVVRIAFTAFVVADLCCSEQRAGRFAIAAWLSGRPSFGGLTSEEAYWSCSIGLVVETSWHRVGVPTHFGGGFAPWVAPTACLLQISLLVGFFASY